jgi:hypothetical protein
MYHDEQIMDRQGKAEVETGQSFDETFFRELGAPRAVA